MDGDLADNAMRFLSEASFETVAFADTLPKGYRRSKSEYFSFPAVQQQETSYREFRFLKEDKIGEASQFIGKMHDAITSWVGKHVTFHQKGSGLSSLFPGTDLAHFFSNHEKEGVADTKFSCRSLGSWQGEDDKTVQTAFSADDSQTGPDFMGDDLTLLSDDSERSIPFSVPRQYRIHRQRSAPLLPGESIRLCEQYGAASKAPSLWVIRLFQPDEKCQGFRFELYPEGDDFAMTLYETEILDNVQVLLELEAGGTEELIFQIHMGMCDKGVEVAGDMIIDHLGQIIAMDQDSLESPETIDGTPELKERVHQLWERGERRPPLYPYSASSNNRESPFARWTMSQKSCRAKLMA